MNLYFVEADEDMPWMVPGGVVIGVEASRYVVAENEQRAIVVRLQHPDPYMADLRDDEEWLNLLHPKLLTENVPGPSRVLDEHCKKDRAIVVATGFDEGCPTLSHGIAFRNGRFIPVHHKRQKT